MKGTALHAAVSGGHEAVISLILRAGSDVNAADITQRTPIEYAINSMHPQPEILALLVEAGSNIRKNNLFELLFFACQNTRLAKALT